MSSRKASKSKTPRPAFKLHSQDGMVHDGNDVLREVTERRAAAREAEEQARKAAEENARKAHAQARARQQSRAGTSYARNFEQDVDADDEDDDQDDDSAAGRKSDDGSGDADSAHFTVHGDLNEWFKAKLAEQAAKNDEEYMAFKARLEEDMRARAESLAQEYTTPQVPSQPAVKPPRLSNPKTDGQNKLAEHVRNHTIALMDARITLKSRERTYHNIKGNADADTLPPGSKRLPSPLVLALGPSDDPKCPWNVECANRFVYSFLAAHSQYTMSSHGPAIKKSFLTYVATLRSHYKNHLDPPTNLEGTLKKAQNRRNTGGNNLMDWRVDLIGLYPALEVLMPQGTTFRWCFSRGNTSDDDELPASDDETKLVHKIHEYEWRNPRVTAFLHALDARGRHLQRMQRTNVTRERFISKSARILSNRGPCLHLPEDWYDETWLRNLKENDALSYSELRVAPPANTNWDTLMEFLRVR